MKKIMLFLSLAAFVSIVSCEKPAAGYDDDETRMPNDSIPAGLASNELNVAFIADTISVPLNGDRVIVAIEGQNEWLTAEYSQDSGLSVAVTETPVYSLPTDFHESFPREASLAIAFDDGTRDTLTVRQKPYPLVDTLIVNTQKFVDTTPYNWWLEFDMTLGENTSDILFCAMDFYYVQADLGFDLIDDWKELSEVVTDLILSGGNEMISVYTYDDYRAAKESTGEFWIPASNGQSIQSIFFYIPVDDEGNKGSVISVRWYLTA